MYSDSGYTHLQNFEPSICMVGDEDLSGPLRFTVRFDIFELITGEGVSHVTHFVEEPSLKNFLQRLTDLRLQTATHISSSYDFPVRVEEVITFAPEQ